jgi:Flp pilus assembly protein protease CpaA
MSDPATPDAPDAALPPSLRLLKWLVIILTLTMIGGVITVVGLIVTRMPQAFTAAAPSVPEGLVLPEGKTAAAVTFGKGWIAVVTTDDHILIFGKDGKLRQDVVVSPSPAP